MRLIDADELIEHVWRDRVDSRERIANLVESMPTIKTIPATGIAPMVHAYWRDTGSGQECSACKEIQYGYDTGRYFCANCGAKMDGEE
jgi:hypothetical protein